MSFPNSIQVSIDGWFNNLRNDFIPINVPSDLIELNGALYFSWVEEQTAGNPRVYVGKYDIATETLVDSTFVFEAPQPDEPHNLPCVGYNSSNQILVFCSGFIALPNSAAVRMANSATAYNLDFTNVRDIPETLENTGLLYLKFRIFSDGVIRIYGRDVAHYYVQSNDGGTTWNDMVEVVRNSGVGGNDRIYAWNSVDPINPDNIHTCYTNSNPSSIDSDLYYFYEDYATGVYYDVEGNTLTLPITPSSSAVIETAPERHPNGYGPYIDSTGAPVILYSADFSGSYINLKRWNGTTWDTHVVETGGGATQYIARGIFWEVGNTKHLLLHKRADGNNSISNILEYTSTDWDNWTATGNAIADNQGDYRGINFLGLNLGNTWPRYGLAANQANGNVYLYDRNEEGDAIMSTANIRFEDITDGSHPVKIYNDTTDTVLFNDNLTFASKSASVEVTGDVGTIFIADWLGSNPPTTGSSKYGLTE